MIETTLQEFLTTGVFAFILTFVRVGAALMIMPGLSDSFTPQRIRLLIAIGLTFVLAPAVSVYLPNPIPGTMLLFLLIVMEFVVGVFIGMVARILMAALDIAGMIVSMMSGLGNAQIFNPGSATQGSLVGTVFTVAGMILIFSTNMHHLLFAGVLGSYELFPIGAIPNADDMSQMITKMIAESFTIGMRIAAPFVVISLLVYVGMGVLARLMPQVQVFILALPMQIMLSLATLSIVISASMFFWLHKFEENMVFFLSSAGG